MKLFRKKVFKLQSKFYMRILQLMGIMGAGFLVGCFKYGAPVAEYGVEVNGIHFYGDIKSEDSLKNIPGLTVKLVFEEGWDSLVTTTNATGHFELSHYAYEGDHITMKVIDNDSLANIGYFENKTIDVEISGRDYSNAEKELNVLLKKN
jgi:hypothetical protein